MEHLLGERELGAERDRAAVQALGERMQHPVAPTHEIEVVAEPTQERLERVAVSVDHPRHQRPAGQADVARLCGTHVVHGSDPAIGARDSAPVLPSRLGQNEISKKSHG